MIITFSIPGPARGKGRPRFVRQGNFARAYTPAETVSYESLVRMAAEKSMLGKPPVLGAVAIKIIVTVTVPASWSAKKQREALAGNMRPTKKPDMDNIAKAICDACNGILYRDDAQVTDLMMAKKYGDHDGVRVFMSEV